MLVQVQDGTDSFAERSLIDWLSGWGTVDSPHGVAILNCDLRYDNEIHHFDAVVWTPTSCVVIDVAGLRSDQGGTLHVPLTGRSTLNGVRADLEAADDRSLLERSREHTFAMQNWLAARGLGQRMVHGVALIVPFHPVPVQIDQKVHDPSFDVIVGNDPERLRHYFGVLAQRESHRWTANDVAAAFRGLGILAYLPAPQLLIDEGFLGPIDVTRWHGSPAQAEAEKYAEDLAEMERLAGTRRFRAPWYSPWLLYPRETGDIDFGRAVMRALYALGIFVAVAWVLWFVITAFVTYGPG
ncbi:MULTISPECIES: NERD domain-containing protein [Nocardia]|uniref:NERD domain-containing protein n=1 Tax=Nocardia TaxID=1817 RepID=UPI0018953BA5|nr:MULTISPECIES: NERD domain-containing protein [Nocardia]MBF6348073.1 NERD domain-containing protein [Nocardia flavorosea]